MKAGKPLYQSRAFIQTSEVLQSPGFFHEPNIFVTTKYFFLWLCQVYYQRQGEYFHVFLLNSSGRHLSLLKDPEARFLFENLTPLRGSQLSAPSLASQPPTGIRGLIFLPVQHNKAIPGAKSHREFAGVAAAQKLCRKGLGSRGARMGSGHHPTTGCNQEHKTWGQPPFSHPHQGHNRSQTSLTLLFIFALFLGIWLHLFEEQPSEHLFPLQSFLAMRYHVLFSNLITISFSAFVVIPRPWAPRCTTGSVQLPWLIPSQILQHPWYHMPERETSSW